MIHKPIDFRFESLNHEEIYELIVEIIPGINHKANNLLTKIAGQALLDQMLDKTDTDHPAMHLLLPESCDQIAKLLDKLLLMVYSSEHASQSIQAMDCLSNSISRFQKTNPNRIVTLNNLLPDDCNIWGQYPKLQRAYFFILMMLHECITATDKIRINASLMHNSSSSDIYPDQKNDSQWVQVAFNTNSGGEKISLYNNDFYNPEDQINLVACYQAAADNIFLSFGGRLQINMHDGIEIITKFLLRQESPYTPKHQGKIQKERIYFNPSNKDKTYVKEDKRRLTKSDILS